ncbi:nicotinamide riboside transporter PnuC [Leuconostoc falkenbergense]|uniref:Nicotinamide riboside transporter PnuC n=1 Tax=Leuconostoc falkenbergense TaxID=2766470 RepID=A0ABT7RY64_9LACO|nr:MULTISPECIES: nicotinamide riboside transporter PnuC [Leuconostoc]MDM7646249.1 nicotinamide riboside transporter PnuC [Leuconostoc falkenbergense]MDY5163220.1 nicotinamide riboside transporter PnuC [Leuconostoc falkenbergense]NLT85364.1 nicotinamide mononucleotide transporter [Leuconostoc sp.]HCU42996.1 nicotinamide mononucleotide transporter [Leuconostoc pseudomesenteroides]
MTEETVSRRFWRYFNPKNIVRELLFGWTLAEGTLFIVLVALQGLVWGLGVAHSHTFDWFGLTTGLMNIITVILVAKGRITNYFWGLIYSVMYMPLAFQSQLFGEVALSAFWVVMQFVGIAAWLGFMKRDQITQKDKQDVVATKYMTPKQWLFVIPVFLVILGIVGLILQQAGSRQPYMDGLTTTISMGAQILQTAKFAESWYAWLLFDIVEIVLWARAWTGHADPSAFAMLGMNLALTVNAIYGIIHWRKLTKKE